jgi:protein-tyrosine phosphatase
MPPTRILFVCMGNICRSPTAEAVLRHKLEAAGLEQAVEVASAGTHGHYHAGEAPDPRAQKHARARGYELGRLRAKRVVDEDFSRYDWLFAMDEDNLATLRSLAPAGSRAEMALLMAHANQYASVREVPDPYYGAAAGFDRVLDLVEDACDGLVAVLRRRHGEGTS